MTINLGESIRRLRHKKGITQEKLAQYLGVSFQSVSKWERALAYPDITLLPAIAGFFGVSTDELLGVNRIADEEEILSLIEEYDNLRWDAENKWKVLDSLRERYPQDFRVQLRYMQRLLSQKHHDVAACKDEILRIYENITANCTDDNIRISARTSYISYLAVMSGIKDSGITYEDMQKVIETLPSMDNCRENFCFYHKDFCNSTEKVHEAIEKDIFRLYDSISGLSYDRKLFSLDYQIDLQEKAINALNYIYNDGNYGKMWKVVIHCCHGVLARFYYEKGKEEKVLEHLRKAAELSVRFDNLDRLTTIHSPLFEGRIFDKNTLGSDYSARQVLREYMTVHYNFSDDFKTSAEYKEILSTLS